MARTKGDGKKSPAVEAFEKATTNHNILVDKANKSGKPEDKNAVTHHTKTILEPATVAVQRERFLRVTVGRAEKALSTIENLGKAFNPKSYNCTKEEADKIVTTIFAAADDLKTNVANVLAMKTSDKKVAKRFDFK